MKPSPSVPAEFLQMLALADPSWHAILARGLQAVAEADPTYLPELVHDDYLPTEGRLFAAFAQPFNAVRYVLVGEGPYPRAASATGVCFMDGAVQGLWSPEGLSKQVNRATSLRNFIKMLLVADGLLAADQTSGTALVPVSLKARSIGSPWIQSLDALQTNLQRHGFLLLNAALVFRAHVAPLKDARAWQPLVNVVLSALAQSNAPPTLVLWGKIAVQLQALPAVALLPQLIAEHPYNLSFIQNPTMQKFFGPMHLLMK